MEDWERTAHALMFGVLAALAWIRSRRYPQHLLIVALFGWSLIANGLRLAIDPVLDTGTAPYEGVTWAAYYLDHALVLSFRFVALGVRDRHFLGGPWERVPIVGVLTWVALIFYKELGGGSLVPVHHAIAASTAIVGGLMLGRAVLAPPEELRPPDGVHAVLVLTLAAELVNTALNYFGPLDDTWRDVRAADLLVDAVVLGGYALVLGREGAIGWRASRS